MADNGSLGKASQGAWRSQRVETQKADAAGSSSSRWAPESQNTATTQPLPSRHSTKSAIDSVHASRASKWASPSASRSSGEPLRGTDVASLRKHNSSKPLGGLIDEMALLASPSRGLDAADAAISMNGTKALTLMDLDTQEAFRGYISGKIQAHSDKHGRIRLHRQLTSPLDLSSSCKLSLEEIGLLVRKLREAIVATHRRDPFATEVYLLSSLLSLSSGNFVQLSTAISRLVEVLLPDPSAALKDEGQNRLSSDLSKLVAGDACADLISASPLELLDSFCGLSLLHQALVTVPSASDSGKAAGSDRKGKGRANEVVLLNLSLQDLLQETLAAHAASFQPQAFPASQRIARCLRNGDPLGLLRGMELVPDDARVWYAVLLRLVVTPLNQLTWARLVSSFHQVALPAWVLRPAHDAATQPDAPSWLEQLFLLDAPGEVGTSAAHLAHVFKQGRLDAGGGATQSTTSAPGGKFLSNPAASTLQHWKARIALVAVPEPVPAHLQRETYTNQMAAIKLR